MALFDDTEQHLRALASQGYARLGVCASQAELVALRQRLDDIMQGRVEHTPFFFQHDSPTGEYYDLAYGQGWVGPSLDYRKIEHLERDDLFWAWARNPRFEDIATTALGHPVLMYRALMFGKSAAGGTDLPWHQDGGAFWGLSREPFLQFWTALDDAGEDAGCLEIAPGTHLRGLASPMGGVVPPHLTQSIEPVALPARAGEVILLHNHLWHRSRRNHSGHTRRAFTVACLHAETRCRRKRNPRQFVTLFT